MLKVITVRNFKSIEELTLDISSFNVIVGHNGAGKTNLLKAVQLISRLASGKKITEAFAELELLSGEILFDASHPKVFFSLDLELGGRDIKYSFEITRDIVQGVTGSSSAYRISEETLQNGNPKPILKRLGDKIEIEEDEGGTASSELVNSQLALSLFKKPQIITDTQIFLSSIIVDNFSPEKLRDFGSLANVEANAKMNLVESLYKIYKSDETKYSEIVGELKEIVPELSNMTVEPYQGKFLTLKFTEKNLVNNYSLFSASDGNLRTLATVSAMLQEPRPSLILIDEIENSMHPTRIKPLIALLQYFSEKESSNSQVIVTTHSPMVLNLVRPNQVKYIYKYGGKTRIAKISNNHDVMKKIEREIDSGENELGDLYASGALEAIFMRSSDSRE